MSVTETTTTSWFSRMKNALVSILIGPLLIVVAIILMFWNEGNSIKTYRSLAEGASIVVDVPADSIDPANEGKLVHIAGPVKTDEIPADSDFGISAEGAVAINRDVEMYQWVETQSSETHKDVGGSETTTTTYDYKKEWQSGVVDSSKFKQQAGHENPEPAVYAQNFVVKKAEVGAFEVDGDKVANLGATSAVPLTAEDADTFANSINTSAPVTLTGSVIYVGSSSTAPAVGDLKISYQRVDITDASFVAAQTGNTLAEYTTSNGYTIFLSNSGIVTAAKMFEDAQTANVIITWAIRIGGLVLMFVGFTMFFSIFGVIGDVIPFVGSIVRFGTGLLSFVLTIIIGPIVMAIGWLAYRPLVAIGVIVVGLLIGFGLTYMRRSKMAAAPAAPAAQ
jgi:Transmembrane protein 43